MSRPLRAFCLIRQQPHYRHDSFVAGLKRAGFHVICQPPDYPARPGEVLVTWNRYGDMHAHASRFEIAGGTVIVAENGYLGQDEQGIQHYALAVGGHNGSGRWPQGDGSRWEKLGIALKPWQRNEGGHILVCGQRGIGSPTMASPPNFHYDAADRLRKITGRSIRVRLHPGNGKPKVPLEQDMAGAWAVVIWSSSSGVKALTEGLPVFYRAPHWVCADGALNDLSQIESPLMDDARRLQAMQRMAWAQWSVSEIASGEPFRLLLA